MHVISYYSYIILLDLIYTTPIIGLHGRTKIQIETLCVCVYIGCRLNKNVSPGVNAHI